MDDPTLAKTPLPALLATQGLSFGYGGDPLFSDLTVQVRPGQALLLNGGNGSGKSTLLRLLAGLLGPDEGTVERSTEADGDPVAIAWLGHALGLKTALTVAENLGFGAALYARKGRLGRDQALAAVGLDGFAPVPVRELSAGQRKRVALARLLLVDAPIWLLDEPYANLDPDGCRLVDRLIDHQLRGGGAVVLSVHRAGQAGFSGDRQVLGLQGAA
ncbi:MAG: heme ABC exporter ATP-binding protein CcmA [Xanthomonadales bacterium]|nr:heme ABC exporter ATP-binding protein CcmA [Xanthomonadales bacterium]